MMESKLSGGNVKKTFLILLCLSMLLVACGGSAEETVEEPAATGEVETLEAPATTAAPTLDKIVFGFVPSAEQAELLDNIQPMMDILSDGLGIEVDWDIVSRDWYSHIRLDEKGLKSQIRSI